MSNATETMKAALLAAGKTVPDDASADDIELMHLELEAEQEAAAAPPKPVETKPAKGKGKDAFAEAVARLGTIEAGSKAPAVVAWARENLSKEEFRERYPNL